VVSPCLQGETSSEMVFDVVQFNRKSRFDLLTHFSTRFHEIYPLHSILGSIYHWTRDHRVHHKASETTADPHNATRGFFFAHMGWLYVKKDRDVIKAGKQLDYSDLEKDSAVMFQKMVDPWFALFMCFVLPGLLAMRFCDDTFWHGFWVAGAFRYM